MRILFLSDFGSETGQAYLPGSLLGYIRIITLSGDIRGLSLRKVDLPFM